MARFSLKLRQKSLHLTPNRSSVRSHDQSGSIQSSLPLASPDRVNSASSNETFSEPVHTSSAFPLTVYLPDVTVPPQGPTVQPVPTDHQPARWLWWAGAIAATLTLTWYTQRPQESVLTSHPAFNRAIASAASLARPAVQPAFAPAGWKTMALGNGAVSYVPPASDVTTMAPPAMTVRSNATGDATGNEFDGTWEPYKTRLSLADFTAIAPNQYEWTGKWQGEGYTREYNRSGQLVSNQEGGADIWLQVSYDGRVTNPNQPNLIITVRSDQDLDGQLTNLSAFKLDPQTGAVVERKDFEQLPPVYDVIATRSGRLGGSETKSLEPLGTVTFAYHIAPQDLRNNLPLQLEADNRLFSDRLAQIQQLEAEGWLVKEVPLAN